MSQKKDHVQNESLQTSHSLIIAIPIKVQIQLSEAEILMSNWALNQLKLIASRPKQWFRMRMLPSKQILQSISSRNTVFQLLRLKSIQTKTARCLGKTPSRTQ